MGTTLGFGGGAVCGAVEAVGHPGTMRWPDGEVAELGVKVKPDQRGRVGKRPPPGLVLLSSPWKALLELRFSMERKMGLFTEENTFYTDQYFLLNSRETSRHIFFSTFLFLPFTLYLDAVHYSLSLLEWETVTPSAVS